MALVYRFTRSRPRRNGHPLSASMRPSAIATDTRPFSSFRISLQLRLNSPGLMPGAAYCCAAMGMARLDPVASQEFGLKICGEQLGAAALDYDHDGRVDLVVTQNGSATALWDNVGAKPGLRVRLE